MKELSVSDAMSVIKQVAEKFTATGGEHRLIQAAIEALEKAVSANERH
jgi:acetylglutamate kinase